jgi:hypothetical protein
MGVSSVCALGIPRSGDAAFVMMKPCDRPAIVHSIFLKEVILLRLIAPAYHHDAMNGMQR